MRQNVAETNGCEIGQTDRPFRANRGTLKLLEQFFQYETSQQHFNII